MINLHPFLGYEVELWSGDRGRKGVLHRFATGAYGVSGFTPQITSITINVERGLVIDPARVDFYADYKKTGSFLVNTWGGEESDGV